MTPRRLAPLLAAAALAALAAPRPARAAIELGAGADLALDPQQGAFLLTLSGRTPLGRHVSAGGRAGVLLFTGPDRVGVPLDLSLRVHLGRGYLEALVGPWLAVRGDAVAFHGAIGFGLVTGVLHAGLEVGALDGAGLVGLRLAVPL